jgi:hypothetical protein
MLAASVATVCILYIVVLSAVRTAATFRYRHIIARLTGQTIFQKLFVIYIFPAIGLYLFFIVFCVDSESIFGRNSRVSSNVFGFWLLGIGAIFVNGLGFGRWIAEVADSTKKLTFLREKMSSSPILPSTPRAPITDFGKAVSDALNSPDTWDVAGGGFAISQEAFEEMGRLAAKF